MPFITVAGENQIAIKQGASLPVNIVNFVMANIVGLGAEPVDRIEAMPDPGDIVSTRPPTASGYVNDNQVVYSLTMDSSVGDFDFNWVGLVDDEGVLIAVTYVPTISKTATAGEVPGNNLTRNFLLAYSGIAATAALAVPAATWQIDFNARLLGIDERERLSNLDVYGVLAFYGAAWQVVRQGVTDQYDILAGVGYVAGIRIDNTATQVITGIASTSVWLDVSLQGDISDVSAVIDFVISAAAQADYTDGLGFDHYLVKIADIEADSSVTDLRIDADWMAVHLADTDPHPQYLTPAEGNAAYDPAGGLAAHAAAGDPHSQYLTPAEGNAAYDPAGGLAAHAAAGNPHSQYLTPDEGDAAYDPAGGLAAHAAAGNPHPQYLTLDEGNATYEKRLTGFLGIFPTSSPPTGYLECDGSAISRTTYADLFAFLGTTFGIGDGATTFNIPDLRGEFIRGFNNASGNDPDAATRTDRGDGTGGDVIGSKQAVRTNNISNFNVSGSSNGGSTVGFTVPEDGTYSVWSRHTYGSQSVRIKNRGGQTNPRNVQMMLCIKY